MINIWYLPYLDLPPLRDSSTSSLQFYQQREESTLLQPELMTPSPTPRTPANIRTNTTGTSPMRHFEESRSHPFQRLNPDEHSLTSSSTTNDGRFSNIEQDTRANQASFDIPNMDVSHSGNDRNPNTGRAVGSDESLWFETTKGSNELILKYRTVLSEINITNVVYRKLHTY